MGNPVDEVMQIRSQAQGAMDPEVHEDIVWKENLLSAKIVKNIKGSAIGLKRESYIHWSASNISISRI